MAIRTRVWTTPKGVEKKAWVVDYSDRDGKRHIVTCKSKQQAVAKWAEIKVEISKGTHTAVSASPTVAEAAQLWLDRCTARGLQRATLAGYEEHVRRHINPYLGKLKLANLTTASIRKFETDMLLGKPAPGEADGAKRSHDMVRRVLVSLGLVLADAHDAGAVAQNVAHRRRKGVPPRQRKLQIGVDIPEPKEISALLGTLTGRYRPLLITAILTGLRASELRGLKWADVDLGKRPLLHVRQRADRYNQLDRPKSRAGERKVPLPPMVVNTLKKWRADCPKSRDDLVFPTATGRPARYTDIVERGLKPAMSAAGLTKPKLDKQGEPVLDEAGNPVMTAKYTGLHSLRHFYASWCINRKTDGGLELPLKNVADRLGHASISLTANTYGHLFEGDDSHTELAEAERLLLAAVN